MKKIYGFLAAAALLSMAACTKDDVDAGKVPTPSTPKGDMFMTMNIAMASSAGTRTSTPNQGYEVGKDYENTISNAFIILAEENQGKYTVKFVSGGISSGDVTGNPNGDSGEQTNPGGVEPDPSHSSTYKASFTFDRQTLLADLTDEVTEESETGNGSTHEKGTKKKEYTIFVVANTPTNADFVTALTPADGNTTLDLQQLITATANGYSKANSTFWNSSNFLMSSAAPATHTIYADEIEEGTHTTKAEAYNLGSIKVQRAMSRFDLLTDGAHMKFVGTGDNENEGPGVSANITVEFDAVAMVNMAKTAYLFKVMGLNNTAIADKKGTNGYPLLFGDERESAYADYWTFSPDQVTEGKGDYFNQLFTNFEFNSAKPEESKGTIKDFDTFFADGQDFQTIASLTERDNQYEHPNHNTTNTSYTIWRYAMENTNPDQVANQVNGNSTGVIFRAKLSGDNIPTEYLPTDETQDGQPIYAYNNVILGTAEQLFEYATTSKNENDPGIYESVRDIYWAIIQPLYDANYDDESGDYTDKGETAWWIEIVDNPSLEQEGAGTKTTVYHHGDLTELEEDLVKEGFNIYRPTKVNTTVGEGEANYVPVYYCYYIYWNRHNDNGQNTIMGTMEFASVRNNVYKLAVNKVLRLGHPGKTEDDPYSPKPGTPDEEDEFWLQVECVILPWEVRVNNIEF